MSIGDPIYLPVPVVGTPGTAYAKQIKEFLDETKVRLEARVPLSSLLPGTFDLDNNPIINAEHVGLYEQTQLPATPIGSIQNYQGNLWWVTAAGAAQLTSGNSLNASSLGTIEGDYGGGNPASLRYEDLTERFLMYSDYAGGEWAGLGLEYVDLYGGVGSTNRVRVKWAGAADYDLTLPPAVPAANGTLLQMATTGAVTASSTGLTSMALANNENITLSGTGYVKHGQRRITYPFVAGDISPIPTVGFGTNGGTGGAAVVARVQLTNSVSNNVALKPLPVGARLQQIRVVFSAIGGAGTPTWTFSTLTDSLATASETTSVIAAGGIATVGGNSISAIMMPGSGITIAEGETMVLSVGVGGVGTTRLLSYTYYYDMP